MNPAISAPRPILVVMARPALVVSDSVVHAEDWRNRRPKPVRSLAEGEYRAVRGDATLLAVMAVNTVADEPLIGDKLEHDDSDRHRDQGAGSRLREPGASLQLDASAVVALAPRAVLGWPATIVVVGGARESRPSYSLRPFRCIGDVRRGSSPMLLPLGYVAVPSTCWAVARCGRR